MRIQIRNHPGPYLEIHKYLGGIGPGLSEIESNQYRCRIGKLFLINRVLISRILFRKNVKETQGGATIASDSDDEDYDDEDLATDRSDEDSNSDTDVGVIQPAVDPALKEKLGKLSSLLNTSGKTEDSDEESEDESESEEEKELQNTVSSENETESDAESSSGEQVAAEVKQDSAKRKQKLSAVPSSGKKLKQSVAKGPSDGAEEEDEEAARRKFRENLSKMSVEQILKMKNSLGLKLFNEKWEGVTKGGGDSKAQQRKDFKRENKNRPREMSSKKKVSKFKPVVQVQIGLCAVPYRVLECYSYFGLKVFQ
jgi:hypothetical protein